MSFKKFSLLFLFFSAIAAFFVWKHYRDERIKKEKEDYYNSIYSYSGDYEIGDHVFLGDKGLVAQWVSKNPEEDKEIRKHIKNDPKRKVDYINDDVVTMGERFIIRKNIKTMSREKGESTYRLLIYDTKDQILRKKEIDLLKWLGEKGNDWGLSTVGPTVNKLSNGKEVLTVNIQKYTEKLVNDIPISNTEIKHYYLDLETGEFIDYQPDSQEIKGLFYSFNQGYSGEELPGKQFEKMGIDLNYNTVNSKRNSLNKVKNFQFRKNILRLIKLFKKRIVPIIQLLTKAAVRRIFLIVFHP